MTNPHTRYTRHALIIDPNQYLQVLGALLVAQDFTVVSIKEPGQALAALRKLPHIDVIFCELEMSTLANGDSCALLSALRAQVGPAVPIISCTAHVAQIELARKLGFDGFLGKPLDVARFPQQLEHILKAQAVWER